MDLEGDLDDAHRRTVTVIILVALAIWASYDFDVVEAVPQRGPVAHWLHVLSLVPLVGLLVANVRRRMTPALLDTSVFVVVSLMLWSWIISGGLHVTPDTVSNHLLDTVEISVVMLLGGYHAFEQREARWAAGATLVMFGVSMVAAVLVSDVGEDGFYASMALLATAWLADRLVGANAVLRRHEAVASATAELAYVDTMTGLANRRAALETLTRLPEGAALALVDIDNFKRVNDVHGHAAGDDVIVAVAEQLVATVRDDDLVARWGGEEFLVVLPPVRERQVAHVVERLRAAVEHAPTEPRTTVSAGAAFVRTGECWESTLARADAALYDAKEGGRNRTVVASGKGDPPAADADADADAATDGATDVGAA